MDDKGFTQGIAWAIAVCNRTGQEGAARLLLVESGLHLAAFRKAGVDAYDLCQVRALCREMNRLAPKPAAMGEEA